MINSNIPKNVCDGNCFIVKTHDGKKCLLQVVTDPYPESPRKWDNVGTMVCWHRQYRLGDEHKYAGPEDFLATLATGKDTYEREDDRRLAEDNDEDYDDPEHWDTEKLISIIKENHVIFPLWLYDHSGITMSMSRTSFGAWDTSQVGWIYVSKEEAFKKCGNITEENWRELAAEYLKSEIQVYVYYLTDSVFGRKIYEIEGNEATNEIDSCYGIYGHDTEHNGIFDGLTVLRKTDIREEVTTRIFIA